VVKGNRTCSREQRSKRDLVEVTLFSALFSFRNVWIVGRRQFVSVLYALCSLLSSSNARRTRTLGLRIRKSATRRSLIVRKAINLRLKDWFTFVRRYIAVVLALKCLFDLVKKGQKDFLE
jgi:hypothetical protein